MTVTPAAVAAAAPAALSRRGRTGTDSAAIFVVVYYCRTYVKAVRGGGSEEGGPARDGRAWEATMM